MHISQLLNKIRFTLQYHFSKEVLYHEKFSKDVSTKIKKIKEF